MTCNYVWFPYHYYITSFPDNVRLPNILLFFLIFQKIDRPCFGLGCQKHVSISRGLALFSKVCSAQCHSELSELQLFIFFFCFPHSLQIASPVSIAVQCGMIHLASRQASLGFASNSPNSLTKLEGQIGFPGCTASHLSASTIIWFYSTVQNLVCSPQSNILSAILA